MRSFRPLIAPHYDGNYNLSPFVMYCIFSGKMNIGIAAPKWDKLSPREFLQLQELASCKCKRSKSNCTNQKHTFTTGENANDGQSDSPSFCHFVLFLAWTDRPIKIFLFTLKFAIRLTDICLRRLFKQVNSLSFNTIN